MVTTPAANGTVSVKTKTETVSLGASVAIGSFAVPGAGEYDVAGIQCAAVNLAAGTAYFFHAEDLALTYLSRVSPDITSQDDAASTDILVVDIRSDDRPEDLRPILKASEPFYVALLGSGDTQEFRAALQLPAYEGDTLKVTRSGLPLEGTFLLPGR